MDFYRSQAYISEHRSETIKNLCGFMATDTILFWSENADLFAYQQKHWQPLLDVLIAVFKLNLQPTTKLDPQENKFSEEVFANHLNSMSDRELTGCFLAAREMKSVLLGLLLVKHKISVSEAYNAAFLEELYQNKFWGEDVAACNLREKAKNNLEKIAEYIAK